MGIGSHRKPGEPRPRAEIATWLEMPIPRPDMTDDQLCELVDEIAHYHITDDGPLEARILKPRRGQQYPVAQFRGSITAITAGFVAVMTAWEKEERLLAEARDADADIGERDKADQALADIIPLSMRDDDEPGSQGE